MVEVENVEQAVTNVQVPGLRALVVEAVQALSDREHQERVWIRLERPHPGYEDNLDMNISILFDDTSILPDPLSGVGWYIYPDEVEPLRELGSVLDPMIDEIGDAADSAYLAHPRWNEVVRLAGVALQVMRTHEGAV
ncbi:SCO4402 family protein [Amycolatopsis silviterrae]|uniref:Uncharacterized protein n=1 Tax=Amycolatopsis silviterrae TaxID=1656914 RepID=A0ABW5H3V2_9PSEU